MPVLTKFYFFDMLNPRDLFHNYEKPVLEERGPYTFRYNIYSVTLRKVGLVKSGTNLLHSFI